MKINTYVTKISKILEKIKWLCIFIFFMLSIFINYYFYKINFFIRIFIISFLIIFALSTILYTKKGKNILLYINESKKEIQKITWPQYKDTLYTTLVVICVTIIISLILWGLDSIIFYLITSIINLRL